MRYINKNLEDIPQSLIPPTDEDKSEQITAASKKVNEIRNEMIKAKKYLKKADCLYKAKDVKDKLESLYLHKCAYCEQRIEQYHVEHYRPKRALSNIIDQPHDGYYWLSLSWDNLMIACPTCNEKKGSKFNIKKDRVTINTKPSPNKKLSNINTLSADYDLIEKPLLLNPERCNPEEHLWFTVDGQIHGKTEEGIYTITTCGLNRDDLNDQRRAVINDFVTRIVGILERFKDKPFQSIEERIIDELSEFNVELSDIDKPFTMFRKSAKEWYHEIIDMAKTNNRIDIQ